ncbi:MAG: type II toxin-antitoxin system HicA family toxin [Flavobacterium sp.]|nr:type II toxin-antitoxin system HicA family toxin [Flavobacterium sp.]
MSRLKICSAKELERIILKLGFEIIRQKGSHKFYRHLDGRYTTIPHYANEDLSRPLLKAILQQIDCNAEDYIKLLG